MTLSFALQRSGPSALASLSAFKQLLQSLNAAELDEREVARSIILLARTSSEPLNGTSMWGPSANVGDSLGAGYKWDLHVFVSGLRERLPKLDWNRIYGQCFDIPDFFCGDLRAFEVYIVIHRLVFGAVPFPIQSFYGKWSNTKGQVGFLKWATQAPKELIDLVHLASKRILLPDSVASAPPSTRVIASGWLQQQWNSLDLLTTIINIAAEETSGDYGKQLLDFASRQATELVLIGLCQIPLPWSELHKDVVFRLITALLVGHSSAIFVLIRVWALNPTLVISAMVNYYRQESNCLSRLLDIAQELKGLSAILEEKVYPFTIDMAALAARREYLNLEKWIQDKLNAFQEPFAKECLNFLQIKLIGINKTTNTGAPITIPLSNEAYMTFLKLLQNNAQNYSPQFQAALRDVTAMCSQVFPSLENNGMPNGAEQQQSVFPPDVEERANSFYEKIYTGELPLAGFVDLMTKMLKSNDPKDKMVAESMVKTLFDEFRFFHKYPDRELLITGDIFGSLIRYEFLEPSQLALGLRYVLDSLQRPLGTKMFRFGVTALMQFQSRLPDWPQYCSHLLQISQLNDAHPDIYKAVQKSFENPNTKSTAPAEDEDLTGEVKQGTVAQLTSDSLATRSSDHSAPSHAVQEKLLFILNNLSDSNVKGKVSEIKGLVTENIFSWLSSYLIVKRIIIEPNYHHVYMMLIDGIDIADFSKAILEETLSNIKILLASEKALDSVQERSLLKNLGSWLGAITLARNKPIKHKDLPLKQLLIEAYSKNRLIVTIPFVCKVLEQCSKSVVFKLPNPWITALLKLLLEFYHFAELKLNLKFEIEVLCRNIDVELKDVEPSELLRMLKYEQQALHPSDNYNGYAVATSKNMQFPAENAPHVVFDEAGNLNVANLAQHVVFNPNIQVFSSHPALKKVVIIALEKAIGEIIGPVVERSVSIAIVATRELASKDFAAEPNEERMRRSAQLMAQNLSGSLAQVTSKEPLKNSFINNLRVMFQQSGLNEAMAESIIAVVVQENLNLGCAVIEKTATEKSVPEINNELSQAYLTRRRQRERGLQWVEPPNQYANFKFPAMLPEFLRWNPNAVQQARIYEDFNRTISYAPPSPAAIDGTMRQGVVSPTEQQQAASVNPLQQVIEKVSVHLNELDAAISKNSEAVVANLPANHEIIALVRQINLIISQFANRDEIALWFAQSLVDLLYKSDSAFGMEIYIILLERISELSKRVAREFFVWLLFADDERKYNVEVSVALIQSGLLNTHELDSYMAKEMDSVKLPLIEFATKLIHKCLYADIVTPNEFHYSILSLAKLFNGKHLPESMNDAVAEIRQKSPGVFMSQEPDVLSRKESLIILFDEWVRALQKGTVENAWSHFLPFMKEKKVLEDDDMFAAFIRYSTEVSVDTYYKLRNAPGGAIIGYQVIDSLSTLIVCLLKNVFKTDDARVSKFSRIMSILALVTIHMHEVRRELFDQKPFFRLFGGILEDLNSHKAFFSSIHFNLISAFGNTMKLLKPTKLPGFIFAWLELVSHRLFMPVLLQESDKAGWKLLHDLLVDIFSFMTPFLRHADMSDPIRVLYKGLLRVLLLLLHDFPEFLCDYHFSLCDLIPPSCIQLRNLILSAFPRNMRLPDPFTPNLKVDLLPEINKTPLIASEYKHKLKEHDLLVSVEAYLQSRGPHVFLEELKQKLVSDTFTSGSNFDVALINALVLHVGIYAISQTQNKTAGASGITQSAPMDIFQKLVMDLDAEGRYHFINAIANQLRYPNSHTHYFSCVLLYLFAEASSELIQEQITRVLLERLIVNRPHPWGLLITFIELLKNPRYNFWNHSFTRCAADIERLFESVARSCMIPQPSGMNGTLGMINGPTAGQ